MIAPALPLPDAVAFCRALCTAAQEDRSVGHRPWWSGVGHLAGIGCYVESRLDCVMLGQRAVVWSRYENITEDVRAAYRSLAWVLFRAARGMS